MIKATQKVALIFCAFGKWMCFRLFFWWLLANKPSLINLLVHHTHLLNCIPTKAKKLVNLLAIKYNGKSIAIDESSVRIMRGLFM